MWHEHDLGTIVSTLTGGRIGPASGAHLDPDLRRDSMARQDAWRPIFGQTGPARGHLRERDVRPGDVFLFFGLFREAAFEDGSLAWRRGSTARHVIWGWLQVDEIVGVQSLRPGTMAWARYHPHFYGTRGRNNTLYLSKTTFDLPGGAAIDCHGAGVFPHFSPTLQLTASGSPRCGLWRLPGWFWPANGRTPLSYHGNLTRWQKQGDSVLLDSVSRGQEFVLDCREYPEAGEWLRALIAEGGT
jgi:hypothetical protein